MGRTKFSEDYAIYTPQLKSDSGVPLRINKNLGNFTYEFSPSALAQFGLHAASFCFFILWGEGLSGTLNQGAIWFKKEISIPDGGVINLRDNACFDAKFFADEPLAEVRRKQALFSRYGLASSYMVLRDLQKNFTVAPSQSVAIQVLYDAATERLVKKPVTLEALQAQLIENSNGPVFIKKPLNYYETDLEKYLQMTCRETGALFPGDCDMLLYDEAYVCRAVVEFKKATAKDATPIQEQSFLNYIHKDINKYTRLNILRNSLSQRDGRVIPFVTVFYSVREGQEDQVKLEVIEPSLTLKTSAVFALGEDPAANQALLLQQIAAVCGGL